MAGEAARLTRALAAMASVAAVSVVAVDAATSATWRVDATCRDGRPQGPYELRSANGQLRVAGAFNEGKRTGSFIFWTQDGVRAAHIPYDEGVRSGTIATWYAGEPGREPPRRLESAWRHGSRDGLTRSWYADGRRRLEAEYAAGRIVASVGWTDAGEPMSDAAAHALAERDAEAADAYYAELEALIGDHLPRCD